jgi:lipoate-protein ligase A
MDRSEKVLAPEIWRLLDLGFAEPYTAQAFYEAVAKTVADKDSPNTIILLNPSAPYVCIGFHQELEREIDVEFCRRAGLPIIRRGQGGGATYLDSSQVFYQIVADEDSEAIPAGVEAIFRKILQVPVNVYRTLGLPAEYKSLNDVVIEGNRKISGNGAGRLDGAVVLVGNIILDLDYDMMGRVLKVPSEKFRDKLAKSMREWVTSLNRELGRVPTPDEVKSLLAQEFEKVLNIRLVKDEASEEEKRVFRDEVFPRHHSREWLYMPEQRHRELQGLRKVKISGDARLVEADHKAGKMIRVTLEIVHDTLKDVLISGDFFMMPEEKLPLLEENLRGAVADYPEIHRRVRKFYDDNTVETPGVTVDDLSTAIMKALK